MRLRPSNPRGGLTLADKEFWPTVEIGFPRQYWSVGKKQYIGTFNPNKGDPEDGLTGARFSPFEISSVSTHKASRPKSTKQVATRIATKYLADHQQTALSEILLREDRESLIVTESEVKSYVLGRFSTSGPLCLADLNHHSRQDFMRELLSRESGITLEQQYVRGRSLAATLYQAMPQIHGIRYGSVQVNSKPMTCVMLFEDRTKGMDFEPQELLDLLSGEGLTYLYEAAAGRKFTFCESLARKSGYSL